MKTNCALNTQKHLGSNYAFKVNYMTKHEWTDCLLGFKDANIYQTWSYGVIRWEEKNIRHVILKKNGITISAAQVLVIKAPILEKGIAYVRWGPVWQQGDRNEEQDALRQMLRALFKEFAISRGLLLRVQLPEINNRSFNMRELFEAEGYNWIGQTEQTILIDLKPSMDTITAKMNRSWKRALKKCRKMAPIVVQGHGDELFQTFLMLHEEMVTRKGHDPGLDVYEYRKIQKDLPDALKMQIMICNFNDKPVAAVIGTLINQKGIALLGATGREGLSSGAYHFLVLKMIEWMKGRGASTFDFGGYDPKLNPGTARFKQGLTMETISYGGRFEAYCNLTSNVIVKSSEQFKNSIRKSKYIFKEFF
jgi:lipid II:glycine glycyltransferase (peptidoglycan interpeptide bridge formation enzyme)